MASVSSSSAPGDRYLMASFLTQRPLGRAGSTQALLVRAWWLGDTFLVASFAAYMVITAALVHASRTVGAWLMLDGEAVALAVGVYMVSLTLLLHIIWRLEAIEDDAREN